MSHAPVAVVDPYAAGTLLGPAFQRSGVRCIGVHGTGDVPDGFLSGYSADGLSEELRHDGDYATLVSTLRSREVAAVIAGCELGVDLAERLAHDLGLRTNVAESRLARRDKVRMVEAVRIHGLQTPAQKSSALLEDLLDWRVDCCRWPIVTKPLQGTASEGVTLCHTVDEMAAGFDAVYGRHNSLGTINDSVLAQEFVEGTEYAVDTVTCRGRHRLAAAWEYGRIDPLTPSVGYESMSLLPSQSPKVEQLFSFVCAALDALGIENSPAHTEVIDCEVGLTFIETGARLCGGINPHLSRACAGEGQVELLVESVLDPETFLAQQNKSYHLDRGARLVFLVPRSSGRLAALPRLDEIEALPSFHRLRARPRPDEMASRIVGWVSLVHEEVAVLERDVARIRWLEENGLYELRPPSPSKPDSEGTRGDR